MRRQDLHVQRLNLSRLHGSECIPDEIERLMDDDGQPRVTPAQRDLAECACLWAILYGHRDFVCLIGSDEVHAADMLESLKTELETNDLLLADFPEAVFPIQALEGIPHRADGQLYRGERTHIGWTAKDIVLPTIPGSPASGAVTRWPASQGASAA